VSRKPSSKPLHTRRETLAACLAMLSAATLTSVTGRADSFADKLARALQLDASRLGALSSPRARAQLAAHLRSCRAQFISLEASLSSESAVLSSLRELIAEDYARGRIVDIDGWQLASSEALVIAALAASA